MKTTLVFILFLVSLSLWGNVLDEIYYGDFGEINRVVLVTDSKADYSIEQNKENKQIVVIIRNCQKGNKIKNNQDYEGNAVLQTSQVELSNNNLLVRISTDKKPFMKTFVYSDGKHKIVIDIFNTLEPQTAADLTSFAKFYYQTGQKNKILDLYTKIENNAPENNWIYYYWGEILKEKGNYEQALVKLKKVKNTDAKYSDAQKVIVELERKLVSTQEKKSEPVTNKETTVSQNKKQLETAKTTVVKNEDHQTGKGTVTETSQIVKEDSTLADTSAVEIKEIKKLIWTDEELKERYVEYFNMAESYDLRLFLLAGAARNFGDYREALKFYREIEPTVPFIKSVHEELYKLYTGIGDESNAQLIKTLLKESEEKITDNGVLNIRIKLWMALAFALFIALITALLISLHYTKKINSLEPDFSLTDVDYHEEEIKKELEQNYKENEANITQTSNKQNKNRDPLNNEKQSSAYESVTKKSNPNYEIPVKSGKHEETIFDDQLTDDEENELVIDENNAYKSNIKEKISSGGTGEGIGDQEYQRKMIEKLANDGWDTEAIAKEMNLSQREVEFIIKTQNT